MIQARLPDAVLRVLPGGMATAPLLVALREGRTEGLPPEFVTWARRNGFDAGEAVELLPALAAPPYDPEAEERLRHAGRRRRLRGGWGLLGLSAALAVGIALSVGGVPGAGREWSVLTFAIPLVIWGLGQASPPFGVWFCARSLVSLGHELDRISGEWPLTLGLAIVVGGVSCAATAAGYALVARGRGYSPVFGLILGAGSLLFRDLNRP